MCLVVFQKIFQKIFSGAWKRRRKRQNPEKHGQNPEKKSSNPVKLREEGRERGDWVRSRGGGGKIAWHRWLGHGGSLVNEGHGGFDLEAAEARLVTWVWWRRDQWVGLKEATTTRPLGGSNTSEGWLSSSLSLLALFLSSGVWLN